MPRGIVQEIFRDHFKSYNSNHSVSRRERKAVWNILSCRTDKLGYHIDECPNGHHRIKLKNSCKHRSCPQCGSTETEVWLERRKLQALNCKYHHIIITMHHDLHPIWLWNRKLFTNIFFLAAWHTIRELLGSERWLDVYTGALAVFQSWGDELQKHCHLHFIVPAGGLDRNNKWKSVDRKILVPTQVLATKFRGKFLDYLREAFNPFTRSGNRKEKDQVLVAPSGKSVQQCLNLLNKLGRVKWHADIEPAYEHANGIFKYVGRYIRRGPISEKRIIGYNGKQVHITYAHPEKHEESGFNLDVDTFIKRILTHVPEKGTHLVRAYGLFHPSCIDKLNTARRQLGQPPYEPMTELPHAQELLSRMFPDWDAIKCPECGALMRTVYYVYQGQPPPEEMAA